jgi:hypothetical protein
MTTLRAHITKLGRDFEIEVESLSLAARDYLLQYGLKQSLSDSIADKSLTSEEANALADKRLTAILDGKLSVRDGPGRETDPIKVEAKRLATIRVKAAVKKTGAKVDEDTFAAYVAALAGKPETITEATKNVAKAKAVEVDLASLI